MASGITGEVFHIAIIGGGIGGLALAHLLEDISGVRVTVYERDEDASSRAQGYPIGLNTAGIAVLRSACKNFLPELDAVLDRKYSMTGFGFTNPNLDLFFHVSWLADQSKNTTANRWALRHLLASRLTQNLEGQPGRPGIVYNKRFTEFSTASEGNHLVAHFQDGSKSPPVDILVGADGAWSRIRRKKYPTLEYKSLRVANIAGTLPLAEVFPTAEENPSKLYTALFQDSNVNLIRAVDRVGSSMLLLCWEDPSKEMQPHLAWVVTKKIELAEEMERLSKMFTLSKSGDENQGTKRMDESSNTKTDAKALHSYCLDHVRGAGYAAELIELVEKTGPEGMINTTGWQVFSMKAQSKSEISALVRRSNESVPVVILGDAAHATSTHAGLGANTALEDARDMAACVEAIVSSPGTKSELLLQLQETVFQRGAKVIRASTKGTSTNTASGWNATIRDVMLRIVNVFIKISGRFFGAKKQIA